MKKVLFGFVVLFMFSGNVFAQSFSKTTQKEIVDFEKLYGPLVNHDFSNVSTKSTSSFEYVMPIYTQSGGVVFVVGNEYGLRGVLTTKNIKINTEAKAKIESLIKDFSVTTSSADNRICWKCIWQGIQHLVEAIIEIVDAFNAPTPPAP
ncbi:hypothetical protein [Flavobacterium suncheonense]|uniref:hypothetical protein n=1 Tax=Flavobacterium suncheonense TaxID=350894 RepID=UPI003FA35757